MVGEGGLETYRLRPPARLYERYPSAVLIDGFYVVISRGKTTKMRKVETRDRKRKKSKKQGGRGPPGAR